MGTGGVTGLDARTDPNMTPDRPPPLDGSGGPAFQAAAADLVDAARRIPDQLRTFSFPAAGALRYALTPDLLAFLAGLGLPHRRHGTELLFERLDLISATVALRLPSPDYLAMRRWRRSLERCASGSPATYEVKMVTRCACAGERCRGDHEFHPRVRSLAENVGRTPHGPTALLRQRVHHSPVEVPDALRAVFARMAGVRHHLLPPTLWKDLAFVDRAGLADCELAARYLCAAAQRAGVPARTSFGLLLATPYSVPHTWLELELHDRWVPFDPLLLASLVPWGIARPGEWSPTGSLTAGTLRICARNTPLVERPPAGLGLSFPTRQVGD